MSNVLYIVFIKKLITLFVKIYHCTKFRNIIQMQYKFKKI